MEPTNTKRCLFCDEILTSKTSTKEHVIPQWLIQFLNLPQQPLQPSRFTKYGHLVSQRNQHIKSLVCGGVCQNCNGGWMSQLEVQAMPLLKPLIRGDEQVVSLNVKQRETISVWALKTAFMLNLSSDFIHNVPDNHYKLLKNGSLELEQGIYVFGQQHHNDKEMNWCQGTTYELVHTSVEPTHYIEVLRVKSYKITLQLGKLLLLVCYLSLQVLKPVLWSGIHIPLLYRHGECKYYDNSNFPWHNSSAALIEFHNGLGASISQ